MDFSALAYGQIRSTTLIPVSRISVAGTCSSWDGGSRWIGHFLLFPVPAYCLRSHPSRLNTRPANSSPTGTAIGPAVSTAFVPRTSPSVDFIAMQRTMLSPVCCAIHNQLLAVVVYLDGIQKCRQSLLPENGCPEQDPLPAQPRQCVFHPFNASPHFSCFHSYAFRTADDLRDLLRNVLPDGHGCNTD